MNAPAGPSTAVEPVPPAESRDASIGVREVTSRRRLAAEAAGIVLITLAMAYQAIPALRDRRQTFFEDVILNWFGPQAHGLGRLADAGIWLPVWLRTNYGGEPYLANTQHGAVYPGNLPFWFLPTSTALEVVVVVHFAISAAAMWAYCRLGLRTSMWAAWLAAVCFTFGGATLAHITLGGQVQVICLMPVVFLTGHMALQQRTMRWVVACAVAIGLAFLAGHVEEWLYIMVALALYGAAWILFSDRGGYLRRLRQASATLGGAVGLFLLLFGWQLFPSLRLSRYTYRNSPDFRQQYPLPKRWALNSLLPDYDRLLNGENIGFVGFAAVCLVGLALAARNRQLLWVRIFVAVSVAAGLLLATGNQNPAYSFLYEHVSLLRGFRVPSRWLLLASFALCVGAALGLDRLLTANVGRWRARLTDGAAGLLVLVLGAGAAVLVVDVVDNGRATRTWWAVVVGVGAGAWLLASVRRVPRAVPALLILATASVELMHARPHAEWRQKAPNALYDVYGDNLETLSDQGGRYLSIADRPKDARQLGEIPLPADQPPGAEALRYYWAGVVTRMVARPDTNLAVQAETIVGRDGGFLPLRWYREFYYAASGGDGDLTLGLVLAPPSQWNWQTLDMMAVRWFITGDDLPAAERAVLTSHGFRIDGRWGYTLRWKRDGVSLARLVHDVDVLPSPADRLARLHAGYPLAQRAIVEKPVQIDPAPASAAGDRVEATTALTGTVEVKVTTGQRSLLVLADQWYPGWQVTVDGSPADLVRADHAFRGVVVPAGEHQVRFVFVDRPLQFGAGLAALTVLGLALVPVAARLRTRPARARRGEAEADAVADADAAVDGSGADGGGSGAREVHGRSG